MIQEVDSGVDGASTALSHGESVASVSAGGATDLPWAGFGPGVKAV